MAKKLTEVASRLASRGASEREIIYIVDFENIPKTDVAALLRKKHVVMVVLAANRTNTVTPETLKTIEANPDRVDVIIGRITRKEFVDKLVTAKIGEYAFRFPEAEIIVLANDKDYADLAVHLNDHWEREVPIVHVAPDASSGGRRRRSSPRSAPKPPAKSRSRAPAKKADEQAPKDRSEDSAKKPRRTAQASTEKPPRTKKDKARRGASEKAAPSAEKKAASSAEKKAAPSAEKKAASKKTDSGTKKRSRKKRQEAPVEPSRPAITNPDAEAVRGLLANLPKRRLPRSESALLNAVRNYRESVGLRSRPSTIVKHLEECGVLDLSASPVGYNLSP